MGKRGKWGTKLNDVKNDDFLVIFEGFLADGVCGRRICERDKCGRVGEKGF